MLIRGVYYPEEFKKKVVEEIESGKHSQNSARKAYKIGGKMTISKWLKKYGTLGYHIKEVPMSRKSKPEDPKDARIQELEEELILYKGLIKHSAYFQRPEVKKKIATEISSIYKRAVENPEETHLASEKSVLYSASVGKPITSRKEGKKSEKKRRK